MIHDQSTCNYLWLHTMKKINQIICLVFLSFMYSIAIAQGEQKSVEPVKTIAALNLARYQGVWYEIAKFPNWFQRNCIANTNANYQIQEDGSVSVTNRCTMEGGKIAEAVGSARQVGGPTSPTLEVRFAPAWLSFLPMVWGDYWVIDIDSQYQLAAVSDPRREYLWILSRTKTVEPIQYQALLGRLVKDNGFNLDQLSFTPQN